MRWSRIAPAVLALLALASCGGGPPASPSAGPGYGADSLWDDGRAEVATYAGTTDRGGREWPTTARLVVVNEGLARAPGGRSVPPGNAAGVLSLDFGVDVSAGGGAEHERVSMLLGRRILDGLEETASRTDREGITFVRLRRRNGRFMHDVHAPGDGGAGHETALRWPAEDRPRVLYDALPLWLRQWASREQPPFERRIWLLPGQTSGCSPATLARPVDALVRMTDGGTVEVPAGRFAAVQFAVAAEGSADAFWFDAAFPHVLLKVQAAARRTLLLERSGRVPYPLRDSTLAQP